MQFRLGGGDVYCLTLPLLMWGLCVWSLLCSAALSMQFCMQHAVMQICYAELFILPSRFPLVIHTLENKVAKLAYRGHLSWGAQTII